MAKKKRQKSNKRSQQTKSTVATVNASALPTAKKSKISLLIYPALITGLVFFIYWHAFDGEFFFDDENNIQQNITLRISDLSPESLYSAGFDSPHPRRFVAYISFALNYYFHEYDTFGYRFINVLIHLLTGLFIFLLVKATLSLPALKERYKPYKEVAFFTALIWLVHPIAIQSVTYVVQRMTSLSAMFYVLALLMYVQGRLSKSKQKYLFFLGCFLSGILAIASKEIAITLPFFICLYEWYFLQDLKTSWLKRYGTALAVTLIIMAGFALYCLGDNPFKSILSGYGHRPFTLQERLLTELRVVIHYISIILLPYPSRLSLDHNFPLSSSLINPITTLFSLFTIAFLLYLALFKAQKQRLLSFCILWFFGNLIIESSVLALEIIFEHRTYLPSIAVILLTVVAVYRFIKPQKLLLSTLCIVTLIFSYWTYQRNIVWSSPITLYRSIIDKYPTLPRAHTNLGTYLVRDGKTEKAIEHFYEAIKLHPEFASARASLGQALFSVGRDKEAIEQLEKSIELHPSAAALSNLGGALVRKGEYERALTTLTEALKLDPNVAQTYYNLGVAHSNLNNDDKAISNYKSAIKLNSKYADAYDNLGATLAKQGNLPDALNAFSKAVAAAPDHVNARVHFGMALLQNGKNEEAISHLKKALKLQPGNTEARRLLDYASKR